MGIKTVMLTGDNRRVAKHIANELHLDNYFAEVPQHQKVYRVKEIQKQGFVTAVTGDSISDATTLAQADIGLAIGAGTDLKTKTADIVLVHTNPQDVVRTIKMSIKSRKKSTRIFFGHSFTTLLPFLWLQEFFTLGV
jgi:Cu2+-exporting ATPase